MEGMSSFRGRIRHRGVESCSGERHPPPSIGDQTGLRYCWLPPFLPPTSGSSQSPEKGCCLLVLSCGSSDTFVAAISRQRGSRSLEKGTDRKAVKERGDAVQKEEHLGK